MVGDALVVLGNVALEVLDVILLLGECGCKVVIGREAFLIFLVGVNLLLGLALGLQLGHGLLGHGQRSGLKVFQLLNLLGQVFDLGQLLFLLGNQLRDGLFVGVDLVDLALDDLIELRTHHVRVRVEATPRLIDLPGQLVPNRLEPSAYCTKHFISY